MAPYVSELVTAGSFLCLAVAGHHIHKKVEHHYPGKGKIAYLLLLMGHPVTIHTFEGYIVHFVVYSSYGIAQIVGGH